MDDNDIRMAVARCLLRDPKSGLEAAERAAAQSLGLPAEAVRRVCEPETAQA